MDFTPESVASFLATVASFPIKAVIVSDIDSLVFRDDYNPDEIMEHSEVEVHFSPLFHADHAGTVSQRHTIPRDSQHTSLQQLLQQMEVVQGCNALFPLFPRCLRRSNHRLTFPPNMILARNSRCSEMEGFLTHRLVRNQSFHSSPCMSLRPLSRLPVRVSDILGLVERFIEHSTPCSLSSSLKTESPSPSKSYLRSPSKSSFSETSIILSRQLSETPSKSSRQLSETPSLFDRVLALRDSSSPAGESSSEQYLLDHLNLPLSQATDRAVGQLTSRGDRTNASLNTIRQLFNGTRGNPS